MVFSRVNFYGFKYEHCPPGIRENPVFPGFRGAPGGPPRGRFSRFFPDFPGNPGNPGKSGKSGEIREIRRFSRKSAKSGEIRDSGIPGKLRISARPRAILRISRSACQKISPTRLRLARPASPGKHTRRQPTGHVAYNIFKRIKLPRINFTHQKNITPTKYSDF